uniref:Large ribosomal subunit protein uL15 n=1 Tax=uncultured Chloroflexi bacterium Rifle_16ft_4_minimus_6153 TaxID=1665079 RepID=A0A0H4TDD4_9CHLR|nr:50S ribosomal protein L15, large subunit ribosomal protein L15 [uncultured Chloroflexi bacterium Rifle_16ft_4_minimus_6153]
MKLHDLAPTDGAKKKRKRVGRGIAAGQGKTAGRGTKGEGARKAKGGSLYRQGGNLPFFRSLPFKRGFTNIRRVEYAEVNLDRLAEFPAGAELNPASLAQAGAGRPHPRRGAEGGPAGARPRETGADPQSASRQQVGGGEGGSRGRQSGDHRLSARPFGPEVFDP